MIKNVKITKNTILIGLKAKQNLNNSPKKESAKHQTLKRNICAFIGAILDFNQESSDQIMDIENICLQINKQDVVDLWNQVIRLQLDKFVAKINCLINLQKGNMEGLTISMNLRISKCINQINRVFQTISRKQNWCLCQRQTCQSRYSSTQTSKRISEYCLIRLSKNINGKMQFKQKKQLMNSKFITASDDQQCNLITLKQIQNGYYGNKTQINKIQEERNGEEQASVIQYLKELRICEAQRVNSFASFQWAQKLKDRYKKL